MGAPESFSVAAGSVGLGSVGVGADEARLCLRTYVFREDRRANKSNATDDELCCLLYPLFWLLFFFFPVTPLPDLVDRLRFVSVAIRPRVTDSYGSIPRAFCLRRRQLRIADDDDTTWIRDGMIHPIIIHRYARLFRHRL